MNSGLKFAHNLDAYNNSPQLQRSGVQLLNPSQEQLTFHCGRPGHVVRYYRERRAIFDANRTHRRNIDESRIEMREPEKGAFTQPT
ncbi:hypothetical protein AVEN_211570-1 [Araneus ventricosus]|uniref:Uncharacterized protein n=1 Tax=Araneus ventricosus TaxID=182803 RepID=A0A4Y2D8H4_ARAVE|nr:hypothetical protein AVEN_211570-1 [Araneus ventricosus]